MSKVLLGMTTGDTYTYNALGQRVSSRYPGGPISLLFDPAAFASLG